MTTSTPHQSPNSEPTPEPNPDPPAAPEPTLIAARVAANRWRNSPRIRERLMKVAGLRQRGLSQTAIANRLGASAATISRDFRRLELLWRQEHVHLANAERLRSLASLREAERHCWQLIEDNEGDDERISQLNGVRSNLTAIQREVRTLLEHVRPPQPEDYWGYSSIGSPPSDRIALEERYQPADKRVLGLLPYEDDPPDDNPEQVQRRKVVGDLMTAIIAVEDDAALATIETLLKNANSDLAELHREEDGDGGGASRNGASGELPYDW